MPEPANEVGLHGIAETEADMHTVTDTFTFTCECEATVNVVGGVQQPHDCPLTEDERQAIRDAAAEAFSGT
jgi:hypothetical protein